MGQFGEQSRGALRVKPEPFDDDGRGTIDDGRVHVGEMVNKRLKHFNNVGSALRRSRSDCLPSPLGQVVCFATGMHVLGIAEQLHAFIN
ncbi:MAG: hypothetical protein JWR32_650 [Mycobacterium sp.]|nr:hypothetical protein [Mycobacterium sp.]